MRYISDKNVVHGDLALRNILLDANMNAKISDFGLSKNLYEYQNYVRKKQVMLTNSAFLILFVVEFDVK